MPGKVNPVIAESLLMVCAQVIGYDATIAWCAAAGNFELNVMMPVMAYDLLESIELLAAATQNFARKLVDGLEADRERARSFVEQSLAMGNGARAGDRVREGRGAGEGSVRGPAHGSRSCAGEERIAPERLRALLDPGRKRAPERSALLMM